VESVSRFPGTWILECPAAHKLEIHVPGNRWWNQSDDSEGHGFWSARRLTSSKSMSLGTRGHRARALHIAKWLIVTSHGAGRSVRISMRCASRGHRIRAFHIAKWLMVTSPGAGRSVSISRRWASRRLRIRAFHIARLILKFPGAGRSVRISRRLASRGHRIRALHIAKWLALACP
jgi:hypothetical protein